MTLALTTLADVKESLGITDASLDSYLSNLILRVSLGIENYIGRGDLTAQQLTEGYDSPGTDTLILRRWPVSAIAQITLDTNIVDPTSYLLMRGGKKGIVKKVGMQFTGQMTIPYSQSRWPWGGNPERIQVTYTAGYSPVPVDLEQAAIECVSIWKNRRLYGYPLQSEHLGQYSYNADTSRDFSKSVLPIEILQLLSHYKDLEL